MFKTLACLIALGAVASCDERATHVTLRFQPVKPVEGVRHLDVQVAVKGGTVQTGRVKATSTQDNDGTTNEIEMQIEPTMNGRLVLGRWPPPADTGYSISFTAPSDPAGKAEWPDGSLTVTTDLGDEDGGVVKISKR